MVTTRQAWIGFVVLLLVVLLVIVATMYWQHATGMNYLHVLADNVNKPIGQGCQFANVIGFCEGPQRKRTVYGNNQAGMDRLFGSVPCSIASGIRHDVLAACNWRKYVACLSRRRSR